MANKIIEQHGSCAREHAFSRQRELQDKGDERGAKAWASIAHKIEQLQARPSDPMQ